MDDGGNTIPLPRYPTVEERRAAYPEIAPGERFFAVYKPMADALPDVQRIEDGDTEGIVAYMELMIADTPEHLIDAYHGMIYLKRFRGTIHYLRAASMNGMLGRWVRLFRGENPPIRFADDEYARISNGTLNWWANHKELLNG